MDIIDVMYSAVIKRSHEKSPEANGGFSGKPSHIKLVKGWDAGMHNELVR